MIAEDALTGGEVGREHVNSYKPMDVLTCGKTGPVKAKDTLDVNAADDIMKEQSDMKEVQQDGKGQPNGIVVHGVQRRHWGDVEAGRGGHPRGL